VGRDYSRWRDVYLTLRGRYGARTTRELPGEDGSSVMHVAAPVLDGARVIGVVTVAKPNATVQPFMERSEAKIRHRGLLLLAAAALIGVAVTWWITRAIGRLHRYARTVADGGRAVPPEAGASELAELGRALEAMREKLEGKQYVERYVHTLTHEMKSPLAAIQGAAELLEEEMPAADRGRFLGNIREQAERLRQVGDKMLALATVEHRQALQDPERVAVAALLEQAVQAGTPRLAARRLACSTRGAAGLEVVGERFLLRQALANLLDNAMEFSPPGAAIEIEAGAAGGRVHIAVRDHGPGVPEYALARVFERFYSLPPPAAERKGTGLGLTFVREVAALHGGAAGLANHPQGGAVATLSLPAA
jgi:two-component system sensor histidine kinase CreC